MRSHGDDIPVVIGCCGLRPTRLAVLFPLPSRVSLSVPASDDGMRRIEGPNYLPIVGSVERASARAVSRARWGF